MLHSTHTSMYAWMVGAGTAGQVHASSCTWARLGLSSVCRECISNLLCLHRFAGFIDTNKYRWNAQISWRVDTCFNGAGLVRDRYFEEIGYAATTFRCTERGCVGRK